MDQKFLEELWFKCFPNWQYDQFKQIYVVMVYFDSGNLKATPFY